MTPHRFLAKMPCVLMCKVHVFFCSDVELLNHVAVALFSLQLFISAQPADELKRELLSGYCSERLLLQLEFAKHVPIDQAQSWFWEKLAALHVSLLFCSVSSASISASLVFPCCGHCWRKRCLYTELATAATRPRRKLSVVFV